MAVYYVFDLDGTLTDQYSYYYFLSDFKPRGVYRGGTPSPTQPTEVQDVLDKAYMQFVHLVAEKESSPTPLGLLRPGIIPVCQEILRQKNAGLCGAALMYSNNPNIMVLEFVRDVIHEILGAPIFCTLADWNHRLRVSEITKGQPGVAKKTWKILKEIITEECNGNQVTPEKIMFFDDQNHPDLEMVLPVGNYCHVAPYTFKTSINSITLLYLQAIEYSKGARSAIHYLNSNSKHKFNSLQNHTAEIKRNSPNAAAFGTLAPQPDSSVNDMLSDIRAFPEKSKLLVGGSLKPNHKTRRTRSSYNTSTTYTRKRRRVQKKIRHRR
jgi:hypothetical protein